jgi:hypothetical protein
MERMTAFVAENCDTPAEVEVERVGRRCWSGEVLRVWRDRHFASPGRTVPGPNLQQLQGFGLRIGECVKRPIAKSRRQYALQSAALEIARGLKGIRSRPFPEFIEPALATLHAKPPSGDKWVHEIKFDGYRAQLHKSDAGTKMFTRRGYDWSDRFRNIVSAAGELVRSDRPDRRRAFGFRSAGKRPLQDRWVKQIGLLFLRHPSP